MTFSPITIPHYLFQQKANISASRIDFLPFLTVVFKLLEYIAFHFTFTCYFILWRVRRSMGREDSFKGWKTRSILLEYDINLSITFFFFPNHKQYQFLWLSSVQFSHSVTSDSLRPQESQHARPPCPSPTPRAYSNSCPSSQWCHPAISSSVVPFSSCPQSLPASGSFPMSQLFAWSYLLVKFVFLFSHYCQFLPKWLNLLWS